MENRAKNAPLQRYVDAMRTHGHRAAKIDPLDLIHREEVAALSPERYGLVRDEEGTKEYNVDGIVWTKRVGEKSSSEEMWTLEEIEAHLKTVYVGNIGYEVSAMLVHSSNFADYKTDTTISSCTHLPKRRGYGSRIY